jgi:hypothetical protein
MNAGTASLTSQQYFTTLLVKWDYTYTGTWLGEERD